MVISTHLLHRSRLACYVSHASHLFSIFEHGWQVWRSPNGGEAAEGEASSFLFSRVKVISSGVLCIFLTCAVESFSGTGSFWLCAV